MVLSKKIQKTQRADRKMLSKEGNMQNNHKFKGPS